MADPAKTEDQNILPVQALFNLDNSFNTFIGQGQPFYATVNPSQSGLNITNSTINSTTIGATTPSTGVFTNISAATGQISTAPSNNTDITNKAYVDAIAQGLNPKQAVKCATKASIILSGLQTIDGYTTLSGDRVLVKNETSSPTNGIYIAAAGAWTRALDMDVWSEVPGAYCVILNGSTNGNTGWVSTSADTGTINVTPITFVQFSGTGTYFAGTGLTLSSNTFSITNTGVTAGSYGSASNAVTLGVNAQGQLTSVSATPIAIAASQITSGTISSSLISGSYTGITGVGTLTAGTWNASTIGVAYGGTGATTLTGYVKGNGTSPFTASATVPTTDLSGTISNAQLANSTISGVSLGSNLFSLTIGSGLSGTSYNGSAAVTIANTSPMVYPASGIPNSTGTAWGTSYSTTGSGTVIPLATGATLNNPTVSDYENFTPAAAPAYAEGRVWYDSAAYALSYYNNTTNNVVHIGQELQQQVRNSTGSTIIKGQIVYISGATGQIGSITLAKANAYVSSQVIGVANQDIPNNTNGWVVTQGTVTKFDTSALTEGLPIYLSATTAGAFTSTEPSTPNYAVHMGICLYSNATNGKIYINPINKSIDTGYIIGQIAIAQGGTNGTATPTAGAVPYGTGTAYAFTSAGSTGQVLTSNGSSAPTWTTPATAITLSDDTTTNATRYPLFAAATSGSVSTEYTSSTKYQYNPSTGVLTATQFSGSGAGLTSIPNSALTNSSVTVGSTAISLGGTSTTLAGLTSVTSTTFVGALSGNATSATTATTATNATNTAVTDDTTTNSTFYPTFVSNTTGNLPQTVSSTKFKWNPSTGIVTSTGGGVFGSTAVLGGLTNPIVAQTGSVNNYVQSYIYNANNGISSSADFVAYANNSTDAHGWADMGFTSQTYADTTYTVTGPNEAYLFGSAPSGAGATGNLVIATDNTGSANNIQFYVGGFTQAKSAWKAQITSTGLQSPQLTATNGIVVNSKTVAASFTIPSGSSAMSAGPMTVATGQSVTVSSGSRWVIL